MILKNSKKPLDPLKSENRLIFVIVKTLPVFRYLYVSGKTADTNWACSFINKVQKYRYVAKVAGVNDRILT